MSNTNYSKISQSQNSNNKNILDTIKENPTELQSKGKRANTIIVDESVPDDIMEDVIDTTSQPKKLIIAKVISGAARLNLRESPSKSANILGLLEPGTKVTIEEIYDNWAYVCTESGVKGYVMKEYIQEG